MRLLLTKDWNPVLWISLERTEWIHRPKHSWLKTQKQPQCPSTEECLKKIRDMYTMEHYSAIKKEWNHAIRSNVDATRDYTKWCKSDRERQTSYDIPYLWNLKHDLSINVSMKQKENEKQREETSCQGEGIGEGWSGRLGLVDVSHYKQNG